jgi:hypothetical protein
VQIALRIIGFADENRRRCKDIVQISLRLIGFADVNSIKQLTSMAKLCQ